jgi:chromosomal replication initiator protein
LWTIVWIVGGVVVSEVQVSEPIEVWTAVGQLLRAQLTEAVWYSTFQDVEPIDVTRERLQVRVPSNHVRDRILTRYLPLVTDALSEVINPGCDFEVVVGTSSPSTAGGDPDRLDHELGRAAFDGGPDGATGLALLDAELGFDTVVDVAGLNPRYTFERFVKGASNQFALAASLRVAETPGRSYNPLFIYGAAGLGKTHLLHAIGHYVHHNYQYHEVRYVSTETFLNEFVDAIRNNTTVAFKRRYRDIDVLLIDDIQFLENREGLQEEFFHTFNSLHGASKQIVISSDRVPDAIPTLEERLRGRFKWGLITDIQPPDLETRLAILRNKAERDRVEVPGETLEFIATKITTNIRELEGALIRVTAFSSLNGVPVTMDLAQTLLADLLRETAPRRRTDKELLEEIAAILGFDVEALKGKSRQRPLVTARQIAMYVFRDLTDLSYPAIARLFGNRDHTTVIHAVEKIQRLMSERHQVYDQVTELQQRLKA